MTASNGNSTSRDDTDTTTSSLLAAPISDKSFQYTADLLGGTLIWGGLGWLADRWLGTFPVLFVIGAVVGNLAGLYVMYLHSRPRPAPDPAETPATGTES